MSTPDGICTWSLNSTDAAPAKASFNIGYSSQSGESVFEPDLRELVDRRDFFPGGKYRAVVKLQVHFAAQDPRDDRSGQGTGWLIAPDLIVSAGHCAFDHATNLGRATQIKAYVGYSGSDSINTTAVQFRRVERAAIPRAWMDGNGDQRQDVSFLKLDRPFTSVTPLAYRPTPTEGHFMLSAVGYPGDKMSNGEAGAQMYEQTKDVAFELNKSASNLLEYQISTFPGQTGAPVIARGINSVIGTHIGFSGTKGIASVIRGSYGADYDALKKSFDTPLQGLPSVDGIMYIGLSPTVSKIQAPSSPADEDEGFFDVLKKVMKIGLIIPPPNSIQNASGIRHTRIQAAPASLSAFGGAVAGPVTGVLGAALSAASEFPYNSTGRTVGAVSSSSVHVQPVTRAVLAEAALETVHAMQPQQLERYGIMEEMLRKWERGVFIKPPSNATASLVASVVMESASKVAQVVREAEQDDNIVSANAIAATPASDRLLTSLLNKSGPVNKNDETWSTIRSAVDGIEAVTPSKSLERISDMAIQPPTTINDAKTNDYVQTICARSAMGEAALQSLMKIPALEMNESGLTDSILRHVRSIGSTVLKVAPVVIRSVIEPAMETVVG